MSMAVLVTVIQLIWPYKECLTKDSMHSRLLHFDAVAIFYTKISEIQCVKCRKAHIKQEIRDKLIRIEQALNVWGPMMVMPGETSLTM